MRAPYVGLDPRICVSHYCMRNQRGGSPYFAGGRIQRGSGFGDFLGGIFRSALPFIKNTLFGVGRYALRSGGKLLDDVQGGATFKEAAKNRWDAAKRDAVAVATGGQVGTGRKRKKCCRRKKGQSGSGGKRRRLVAIVRRRRAPAQRRPRSKADFFD